MHDSEVKKKEEAFKNVFLSSTLIK